MSGVDRFDQDCVRFELLHFSELLRSCLFVGHIFLSQNHLYFSLKDPAEKKLRQALPPSAPGF
jgi:hypothetical protein